MSIGNNKDQSENVPIYHPEQMVPVPGLSTSSLIIDEIYNAMDGSRLNRFETCRQIPDDDPTLPAFVGTFTFHASLEFKTEKASSFVAFSRHYHNNLNARRGASKVSSNERE